MSIDRWAKFIATTVVTTTILLMNVCFSKLVEANSAIITVPSGDVEALYAAVYNENGSPRDNVEINLEAGVFLLDPSEPFEGRLVLGQKSTLRSTLHMELNNDGVPKVNGNSEPIVVQEGAKIDGSRLTPAAFDEGIIVVGNKGLVEQLWVVDGLRPGIEIADEGTIRKVASTNNSIGIRVRAAGKKAQAKVEQSLAGGNAIYGIGVIAVDPNLGQPSDGMDVHATMERNASVNSGATNFFTIGGLGTDDSKVSVKLFHNLFLTDGGDLVENLRIIGAFDYQAHGGGNNNRMQVDLADNLIIGGEIGIRVEGGRLNSGFLADPSLPLDERKSSYNDVTVNIGQNTFQNNITNVVAYGGLSLTDEPGGDYNEVKILIQDSAQDLAVETHDCYPEENFPSCTNVAIVHH